MPGTESALPVYMPVAPAKSVPANFQSADPTSAPVLSLLTVVPEILPAHPGPLFVIAPVKEQLTSGEPPTGLQLVRTRVPIASTSAEMGLGLVVLTSPLLSHDMAPTSTAAAAAATAAVYGRLS